MPSVILKIRENERRAVVGTFLVLFGILAGHTLMETARDALFLADLPAAHLPWVYLAIAAVGLAASEVGTRFPMRHGLATWLGASGLVTFGFYLLAGLGSSLTLYAIYVWSGVSISIAMVQYWLLLGRLYTIDQAKRLYGLIGAGSVLGALAGAGLSAGVVSVLDARALLAASGLVLAATALGSVALLNRAAPATTSAEPAPLAFRTAIRDILEQPYVARLAALVIVSTVAFTLADYIFKSTVAANVPPGELAAFFSFVYALLNAAALAVQLLLTGWLLRSAGVQRVLLVLPIMLLVASSFMVVAAGLGAALVLKAAEGSLKHSLHRTSTEVLFVPITDRLRPYAKRYIDLLGQRSAQALASIAILAVVAAGGDERVLALALGVTAFAWLVLAVRLRPHYLQLFREHLKKGRYENQVDVSNLDQSSLESLLATLNSSVDQEVLTAIRIFRRAGRGHLLPGLILHHPSKEVVLESLDLLGSVSRTDHLPIVERLLAHPDAEVRAAALRVNPAEKLVALAERDPSQLVRATAFACMVAADHERSPEALRNLELLIERGSPAEQLGVATVIAAQPHPAFEPLLLRLAWVQDPQVLLAVTQAMLARPSPAYLPSLIDMLAHREVRPSARRAFVETGSQALRRLGEVLGQRSLPLTIRRHLPRAIASFRSNEAATLLLQHLTEEPSGVIRYRILRALGRLRSYDPSIRLDEERLGDATAATLRSAYTLLDWRVSLRKGAEADPSRATPGHVMLATLLQDKETHTVERLVRLLGLYFPDEDFDKIYRGLRSTDPVSAASSLELLENFLPGALREAVIGLVVGRVRAIRDEERLKAGARVREPERLEYNALLAHILGFPSDSLRAVAAYHVGELGLIHLRGAMQSIVTEPGSFAGDVIDRALERLNALAIEASRARAAKDV